MTNIVKPDKKKDMRLHIAKAREIIDEYLPVNYVKKVMEKLKIQKIFVSEAIVRNVKSGLNDRLDVLNALVETALENKPLVDNFKKLTT